MSSKLACKSFRFILMKYDFYMNYVDFLSIFNSESNKVEEVCKFVFEKYSFWSRKFNENESAAPLTDVLTSKK